MKFSVTNHEIFVSIDIMSDLCFYYLLLFFCSVTKSCLNVCNPMNCSLPGFSLHGISQARVLEWVAISFSGDLPNPGNESESPAWQVDSLLVRDLGSPLQTLKVFKCLKT